MIGLIVAYDQNRIIGKDGKMPWVIPGELKRFKELTLGNTVIMGRKTFDALGQPLVDRENIVITRNTKLKIPGVIIVHSLQEALSRATHTPYIIGGATIYKEALSLVDVMYITEIDAKFDGDCKFPELDYSQFDKIDMIKVNEAIPYEYQTYVRKEK